MNLAAQIAVCLFFAMFFGTLLAGISLYRSSSEEAKRLNLKLMQTNLIAVQQNIEQTIAAAQQSIISCFFTEEMQRSALSSAASNEPLANYNTIRRRLNSILASNSTIYQATVCRKAGNSISVMMPTPHVLAEAYYYDYTYLQAFLEANGIPFSAYETGNVWFRPMDAENNTSKINTITNVRALHDVNTHEIVSILLVEVRETAVCEQYAAMGEGSFIVDKNGRVLSAVDKALIGKDLSREEAVVNTLSDHHHGQSFAVRYNGAKRQVLTAYLPSLGAYLVSIPEESMLDVTLSSIFSALMTALVGGFACAVVLSMVLSRTVTASVRQLKGVMEQAQGGDLQRRYDGNPYGEIGYLGDAFNRLMDRIEESITDIKEAEQQRRTVEAQLLQSQMNPHLLYNTLDSVQYFIQNEEPRTAQALIEAMSDFFRASLAKGEFYVSLESEVRCVEHYLEIQRLCRDIDITLTVDVPEALMRRRVMKTTLQPLVENCVLHAFAGVPDGSIAIEAREESTRDGVLITVTDDGVGLVPEQLESLRRDVSGAVCVGKSFGLWNLNWRVRHWYGEAYGMEIDSEFGMGTVVRIWLPLEEKAYV